MQKFVTALHCNWLVADDLTSLAREISSHLIHEGYILRTAGPPAGNPIFERAALIVDHQMVVPFAPNDAAGNLAATEFLVRHDEEYWKGISKSHVLPIRAHYGLALAGSKFDAPSEFLLHLDIADKLQLSALRIAKSLGIPSFDLSENAGLEAFNKFMEQK
jgi:hypothetical protein